MQTSAWRFGIGGALLLGGAIMLSYSAWMRWHAREAQNEAKTRMQQPQPSRDRVQRGDVIGKLDIPRLHLSVMVLEGDDDSILDAGAGHIPETALPGMGGNIGIAAHRDTFFRPLRLIRPHDMITLTTRAGVSRFSVDGIEVVAPEDTRALSPGPGRDLTLVTCFPFYYVGPAPKRFIVHARALS